MTIVMDGLIHLRRIEPVRDQEIAPDIPLRDVVWA